MTNRKLAVGFTVLLLAGCAKAPEEAKHAEFAAQAFTASARETFGYSADPRATGVEHGRQVYTQWCAICHEGGPGMAGTESLQRKYKGEVPSLLRERKDLSPELIATFVREGGRSMPYFRKMEISDRQLTDLSLYLTTAAEQAPGGRVIK